jgi:VIT1/CCC1 family predicted Fe2+/Mn2+ transporter
VWGTVISVVAALALTGYSSARFTNAVVSRAIVRTVGGGVLAMGVTYAVGRLVGASL